MTRVAERLIISGQVQGVGFRAWMIREARALGVRGWVRNRADGTVEARLEGEPGPVSTLRELCRQGPVWAAVEKVASEPAPPAPPVGAGWLRLG